MIILNALSSSGVSVMGGRMTHAFMVQLLFIGGCEKGAHEQPVLYEDESNYTSGL